MPEGNDPLGELLDRLEELLEQAQALEPEVRDTVFELLDGVDALHRLAITRLGRALGGELSQLRGADAAVGWLFAAYSVGVDDLGAASAALEQIRPYIREHGGEVEALAVDDGVVQVRLSGACSGCTAAAVTLREGVEDALRTGLPGFVGMDVVADDSGAAPHPPPGPTLLQIQPRPA